MLVTGDSNEAVGHVGSCIEELESGLKSDAAGGDGTELVGRRQASPLNSLLFGDGHAGVQRAGKSAMKEEGGREEGAEKS